MHKNDSATDSEIDAELGHEIMARIDLLAKISEDDGKLTRQYLSDEHARANQLVGEWMQAAGMEIRVDAIGNIIGRYPGTDDGAKALLFGSHLDTVRDAGRYDGMLGVLTPISCVQRLNERGQRFAHAIEIVGFADEEGLRFQSTLLGSRAIAANLDPSLLDARDANGISMRTALCEFGLDPDAIASAARNPQDLLAYVELHIEQGPVLEATGAAVGIVTSIAGATRMRVRVDGVAGHAGTVPMRLRHDAMMAASEMVCAIERAATGGDDLVGTVGQFRVDPGAVNVIPGSAEFSLDVRAGDDAKRLEAIRDIQESLETIASRRGVKLDMETTHNTPSCRCAPWLMRQLAVAAADAETAVPHLASGAGHDAMAMAAITDVAMLFVRCEGGVSHHPAERITAADAAIGAEVLLRFMAGFEVNSTDGVR